MLEDLGVALVEFMVIGVEVTALVKAETVVGEVEKVGVEEVETAEEVGVEVVEEIVEEVGVEVVEEIVEEEEVVVEIFRLRQC